MQFVRNTESFFCGFSAEALFQFEELFSSLKSKSFEGETFKVKIHERFDNVPDHKQTHALHEENGGLTGVDGI